jgi:predicted carbohydrate-binding protein with CBM5 and CBM33 domain
MTVRLRFAAFVAGVVLAGLALLTFGRPASAHGALSSPASRAVMCGLGTAAQQGSAACKAAVAAGADVANWDNIRVPNVNGKDRTTIPDGKLCSGGLAAYKGLDLVRGDWPTTRVTAGATTTLAYKERIPHKGTFKVFVTKDGYNPKQALRWSDLEDTPFLTVTDPPLVGGAYQLKGALPAGKTGPHIIYTIWQNSSTADTYYSCSDVVFSASAASSSSAASPSAGTPPVKASAPAQPAGRSAAPAAEAVRAVPSSGNPSLVTRANESTLSANRGPIIAAGAGGVIALLAVGITLYYRRRSTF